MKKIRHATIGIIYGSDIGDIEFIAERIARQMARERVSLYRLVDLQ